jgi:hypothetical protein
MLQLYIKFEFLSYSYELKVCAKKNQAENIHIFLPRANELNIH